MYIAAGQGQTTPGDKILMSTETSCHFGLCYKLKKTLCSLQSVTGQGQTTPGDKILMSTETSCHFGLCYKLNVFHDFINVYSPEAGADNLLGSKF